MNHWYKSSFTKGIIIIIEHILAAAAVISLIWLLTYPTLLGDLFSGHPAKKFEDSAGFSSQLEITSQKILHGIGFSQLVETEGKYNPDIIVDVKEYSDNYVINNENKSGLAYRLGDLEKWCQSESVINGTLDVSESSDSNANSIIVCKKSDGTYKYYFYSEFAELIKSGDLKFVMANDSANDSGTTSDDIMSYLKNGYLSEGATGEYNFKGVQNKEQKIEYIDCWNYDGFMIIDEKYSPIGAENLLDIVNNNPQWNGKLNDAYNDINNTLTNLSSDIETYQSLQNAWQEGDTNLTYLYANTKTGKVYTNREEYMDYSKLKENINTISKLGKYVIVKPKLSDFQTNLNEANASAWRSFVKEIGTPDSDFIFAVGVDTKYPIQDEFYSQNKVYDKYGATIQSIGILGITSVLLFIVGLVWLTVVAARNNKDEELHLNRFDRWKTELAAAFVIALWIIPVMIVTGNGYGFHIYPAVTYSSEYGEIISQAYDYNVIPTMIAGGAMALWTCAIFLIGYLSLIRRLKGRTLWKNSVIRGLLKFVKVCFVNMHLVWKFVLLFAGFVIIHWIAMSTMGVGTGFFVLVAIIAELVAFVYLVRVAIGRQRVREGIEHISSGEVEYKIPLTGLRGEQLMLAERVNAIGEGLDAALEESMKSERLKTDLITNVSHDIKTPLTSIINYVDLLKKEDFKDPKIIRYLEVLEAKAQRLKTLTEDVVEASKVSSGNITLEFMNINLVEMIQQTSGEFEEKLKARNLTEVLTLPEEEIIIRADGRRMWRILENIYNNAAKYAMEGTRIYADLSATEKTVTFNLKNVSQHALNITADELTERFIRGDVSRSTEGSGLGLSIAKSLAAMQGGTFDLYLDGDLFKVTITFPRIKKEEE